MQKSSDSTENQKKSKWQNFASRGYNFRRLSQISGVAPERTKPTVSEEDKEKPKSTNKSKKRQDSPSRKQKKEVKKRKKEENKKRKKEKVKEKKKEESEDEKQESEDEKPAKSSKRVLSESEPDDLCKICNRRSFNPKCDYDMCKVCCLKVKGKPCTIEAHNRPNAEKSKSDTESDSKTCPKCNKQIRNFNCTMKYCKTCCSDTSCSIHNKSSNDKNCLKCARRAQSANCVERMCKKCCLERNKADCAVHRPKNLPQWLEETSDAPKGKCVKCNSTTSLFDSLCKNCWVGLTDTRRKYFTRRNEGASGEEGGKKCKKCKEAKRECEKGLCESCCSDKRCATHKADNCDECHDALAHKDCIDHMCKGCCASADNKCRVPSHLIAKKQREENLCPHCGHRTRDSGCIEKLCKLCCAEWDNGCKVKSHIKAKDEDEEDEEEERQKECTECGGTSNVGCVENLCKNCCGKNTEVMCALVSHNIAKILHCEKGIDENKKCTKCKLHESHPKCTDKLCKRCCIDTDNSCKIYKQESELCSMCNKKQRNISCAEQLCQSCCAGRENSCFITAHKLAKIIHEKNDSTKCLDCKKNDFNSRCVHKLCVRCCAKQPLECTVVIHKKAKVKFSRGREIEEEDQEKCSSCNIKKTTNQCVNKMCSKCCLKEGGICNVHKKSRAKNALKGTEKVLCFGCRERQANIRCKHILCVQCCVEQGENGCEQKFHTQYKKGGVKFHKSNAPAGMCSICKKSQSNVNCAQQLCRKCCIEKPGNGCKLVSHRRPKVVIVSDSDTESEEEDEKCKMCKQRSGNTNCIENLCRNCCLKRKENKCTIHRKIIKSLAVEFKESLSQKESVISDLVSEIYDELDSDGHHIPKTDEIMTNASGLIKKLGGFGSATYGEIAVRSVPTLCNLLNISKHDVFYDLGCGVGKTVLHVALETNCKKSIGIELSKTRYNICLEALEKLSSDPGVKYKHSKDIPESPRKKNPNSATLSQSPKKKPPPKDVSRIPKDSQSLIPVINTKIKFINDNILTTDISDATCVFWNNVCFPPSLIQDIISQFIKELKPGTRIVCMQKICARHSAGCKNCAYFEMVNEAQVRCTWTFLCGAYVYVRKENPKEDDV